MPYTISAEESRRFNVSRALEILPDAPDAEKVWGVRTLAGQARMTLPDEFTSNPSDALSRLQEAYRTNSIEPLQTDDFKETEKLLRDRNWDELARRGAQSDTLSVKAGDRAMVANDEDVALLDEKDQTRFRDLQKRVKDLSTFDTWQDTGLDVRSREYADRYAQNERDLREAEGQFNALLNEARKRGAAMRHVQRVRQKNAFTLLNSISGDLDDRTREIVDRAVANGYRLADGDEDAFALPEERGGLPESQKELAASFLLYCKPVEGKGAWEAFRKRLGDNAAQVVGNTAAGVGDLFSGVFHGFDKDDYRDRVNRRAWRNRINQRNFADLGTLGNSFAEAGGIIGYWAPQMIGGAVGRGTRLATRLPGAAGRIAARGVGAAGLVNRWGPEAMYFADYRQQFLERVALDGGDVTNPAFQVAATVGAAASAYVEHIQWGRAMGKVGLEEVQAQAYAKLSHRILAKLGIKVGTEFGSMTAGRAARLVLMERGLSAVTEGFEEAIQQAIEETVVQIGDGQGIRLADIADQSGEAFVSTLGPMMWTMMFGLPFRAKSAATMHNLDGDAIDRLMSASSRLKRLASAGKLDQGGDDLASLNELLFVTSRAPNADAGVRSLRERGFSQAQATDIWNTFETIRREAIQHGQMDALGRNVLPTGEELRRTGWEVTDNQDGTTTASRVVETADGRKRRQTINVRSEASQAVDIGDDNQAVSTLNTIRQEVAGRTAPSVSEDGTPGVIPLADKIAATYGFDLSLDNDAILANPAMREGLARYAVDQDLRVSGNTRLTETRKAKDADGNEIDEDVFDVPLTERATRQTIFHEVAHAVAATLRNMGLSEKEIDAIQNWRSGIDGKAPNEADMALPQVEGEVWDEERVGDELGDKLTEPDERGRVARAMNYIGDMTRRILGIQREQQNLRDAVSVLEEAVRRGYFGNIDELNDAQRRVLLAARQKRAEDREKRKAEPPAPGPAEGAVIAPAPPEEEEDETKPEESSSGEEGPSSEPAAEEPKSALDRAIDAFCTNRPLQSDEMAALAASGEVTQDEIYETGYRWHFAANAWAISPEAVGRKFVPSRRYRGLDGKWHDTRRDGGRYEVASRVTPEEDAAYMDAVRRGDMDAAQKMMRAAAAKAMPDTKVVGRDGLPLIVYHGTASKSRFKKFKYGAIFTFSREDLADQYTKARREMWVSPQQTGRVMPLFMNLENPLEIDAKRRLWNNIQVEWSEGPVSTDDVLAYAKEHGHDGVIIRNVRDNMFNDDRSAGTEYIAFSSSQVKSTGATYELRDVGWGMKGEKISSLFGPTYDDAGNVIPLSQRFNPERDDIRYQVAARQTDTAQFKRWFGKSKIVDANGNPLVCAHRTPNDFEAFDIDRSTDLEGREVGLGWGAGKIYLIASERENFLPFREGQSVLKLYVRSENPIDGDEYNRRLDEKIASNPKANPDSPDYDMGERDRLIAELDSEIKAEGHDGIWDRTTGELAVFDPKQVKHATENIGTFGEDDPRFRYQVAAKVTPMTDDEVKRAVEFFGTTDDPNEAAYILPDGRWLDMEQMGEHSEISQAFGAKHKKDADKAAADSGFYGDAEPYVVSALGAGLVRTTGGVFKNGSLVESGIQFGRIPDAETVGHVERFLEAVRAKNPGLERITVDGLGLDGRWSRQYGAEEADAAIRDIRQYAATGTKPHESLVARFHGGRYAVSSRPSPEFAMDGTIADALPAHLREDARAIIAERAGTPAWMADPDGTPTALSERDWLRREAERRHNAPRFAVKPKKSGEPDGNLVAVHFVGMDRYFSMIDAGGKLIAPSIAVSDADSPRYWGAGVNWAEPDSGVVLVMKPEALDNADGNVDIFSSDAGTPMVQMLDDEDIADPEEAVRQLRELRGGEVDNILQGMRTFEADESDASILSLALMMRPVREIGTRQRETIRKPYDVKKDWNAIHDENIRRIVALGKKYGSAAMNVLLDAGENNLDKKEIQKRLAKKSIGRKPASFAKAAQAILDVLDAIDQEPRGYLEAKVYRAVPLTDVAVAIVNEEDAGELVDDLETRGVQKVVVARSKDEVDAAIKQYAPRFQVASTAGAQRLGIRNLADAEAMERSGASRLDIWRETGWWRGAEDGEWRIEVGDIRIKDDAFNRLRNRNAKVKPKYNADNLPTPEEIADDPALVDGIELELVGQLAAETTRYDRIHGFTQFVKDEKEPGGIRFLSFDESYEMHLKDWADKHPELYAILQDAEMLDGPGGVKDSVSRIAAKIKRGDITRGTTKNRARMWWTNYAKKQAVPQTLGELVEGPILDAYPELRNIRIVPWGKSVRNSYAGEAGTNHIAIRMEERGGIKYGPRVVRETLAHEIAHQVQRIEGLTRGSSPERERRNLDRDNTQRARESRTLSAENDLTSTLLRIGIGILERTGKPIDVNAIMARVEKAATDRPDVGRIVDDIVSDLGENDATQDDAERIYDKVMAFVQAKQQEIHPPSEAELLDDAREAYMAAGGEVEARMVEARLDLTDEQKNEIPPWVTEAVVRQDLYGERSDYSYAAQRAMMARMAADGTLDNPPERQTRFAVAPRGVQKQAGVEYPDAGAEIARFQVGAKRRAAYEDVLARKRPDLDADAVLKELDKLDDPKKEKLALHWIVRGTIRLPEDAYKVEDAIEVSGKAKVDPFQYGSPMELLEAHREFKPTPHGPIDPETVPQLTGKTDMGHGVTVYLVQDDAEGQKAMREILNAAYGKEFSPWCLLHGDGKGGLSSQAAHWWKHYASLPKKVAFLDGKPIAFMATHNTNSKEPPTEERAELIEKYHQETGLDHVIPNATPENFDWTQDFKDWLKKHWPPEEWWDLKDVSHEGIPATVQVDGDPLGRVHQALIMPDGALKDDSHGWERHSDGVDEEWYGYTYHRKEQTSKGDIDARWYTNGSKGMEVNVRRAGQALPDVVEWARIDNSGNFSYRDTEADVFIHGSVDAGTVISADGGMNETIFKAVRSAGEWKIDTIGDVDASDFRKAFDAWLARFAELTTRPADSIGPEEREQGGRAAVAGRVRAFDDEPQYSPRASLAAVATMELLAGREPDRDALEQMRTRLGLEADVDEVIGEAKTMLDSAVGEIARRGAGRNPGAVAVAIAESVQGNHPEDLVQEAFRAGANAQKWAQGTRGAALNALVRNTRGDNYADLVMETGVDATGVLQSFPDMVRRRRAERKEPPPAPAGERPDEATEAKPAAAGEPPSLADIGPIDPNSPEGRRIAAIQEGQEANIEKALRETEKEMEQRRLDDWLENADKRDKEAAKSAKDDVDEDGDGGDGDLDESDESGVSDAIRIPVEVLERNLVDVSDPETFTLWLRKVVRNRILKANGLSTDFPDLAAAQAAERDLWANPTNVAAFAKSMSAILRDMARRMLDHRSGAYTEVLRKAATLPHYDNVDAIEDEVAFEVRVMSGASISQTSAQLVNMTRKKLKRDFIGAAKPNEHPELQDDLVRKITGRVREMAKWYRNVLALTEAGVEKMREQLEARLEERGRNLDEAGMTEKADRENDAVWDWTNWKLSVLDRFGGTRYLLPSEARERCGEIQTWMAKEGMAWAQKMEAMTAQYEADRKTIIDGCRIVDRKGRTVKHEKDTRFEGFWRYTVNTIDQRLRLLFARAGGDAGRAAKALRDRISLRLAQGTTRYEREKQEMHRALVQTVRNVVGPRGVRAWIERMTQEIPEEQAVALSKQNNRHLTYGQVMHIYGYLRQTATYGENIAKYGREEQRDYIERNVLTAEDIKILDGIMQIYADNRRALDEASRDITGFPIKNPDPFYLPVKIKQKARSGLETTVSTVQAMPAVFSERRRHGLDVDEKADIMAIFYDRMEQTARVLGFGRTGLDIIHTFGSADVKEAITEARGAKFTTALIAHFTDWMNGGRPRLVTKEGDDAAVLNSLRTAFVYTALWGNTLSAFKQTLSEPVFSLAREAGERGVFRDMMGVFSDGWLQAKAELTQSDPWKARYGDVGVMQETKEAVLGAGEGSLWQAILRAGMQPLQWGDATPGILCQVTAYKVERDRLIEEGMEPEEAKRIAADKAMQQVEWTQQSSRAENLPEFSRRGDAGTRMLMMFASSPMLQAGWEVQRIAEWREKRAAYGRKNFWLLAPFVDLADENKEVRDAAAAAWNAVVVNHVVMPFLFQTATAIFNLALGKKPPDEKDALELIFSMLVGPFARLVFVGGMAKTLWEAHTGTLSFAHSQVAPSMLTSMEQSIRIALADVPIDLINGDMDKALEDIDKFLKLNVAPYRHGRKAYENWTD